MSTYDCIDCVSVKGSGWSLKLGKVRYPIDRWRLTLLAFSLFVILPIAVIFLFFLYPEKEIWQHLAETLLADLMINTAVLCAGVLIGTLTRLRNLRAFGMCKFSKT